MFEQKITPRDIMTGAVCTVQPTDRVKRVIALLCTHRISGVPVGDRKSGSPGLPRDTWEVSAGAGRQGVWRCEKRRPGQECGPSLMTRARVDGSL